MSFEEAENCAAGRKYDVPQSGMRDWSKKKGILLADPSIKSLRESHKISDILKPFYGLRFSPDHSYNPY
jgi:hypothetical protein